MIKKHIESQLGFFEKIDLFAKDIDADKWLIQHAWCSERQKRINIKLRIIWEIWATPKLQLKTNVHQCFLV